jgi:hypothetical protein
MKTIIVFDKYINDWIILKKNFTAIKAKEFIDNYPRFGSEYSRTIREGNWQII